MKKTMILISCLYLLDTAKQFQQEAQSKQNELRTDSQRIYLHQEIDNALEEYRVYLLRYEFCRAQESYNKGDQ